MRLILDSTAAIHDVNGVPARMWEGTTESGVRVYALITRVAVRADAPTEELVRFERELRETPAPRPSAEALLVFPLRMLL